MNTGDVKYHQGFSADIETPGGVLHMALAFNPSHLEIINPVVEGSVRARQDRRKDDEKNTVLPVLIHGDAAFAGQGVVMESLNMSNTRGFSTGALSISSSIIRSASPPETRLMLARRLTVLRWLKWFRHQFFTLMAMIPTP